MRDMDEYRRRADRRQDAFERRLNIGMVMAAVFVIVFWVVVAFVAYHFLAKVW